MTDLFQPLNVETNDQAATFEALVGDGKKFKTADDLAKAKAESDRFIQQVQRENEELRKEVASKQTIDEILTKVREMSNQPQQVQPTVTPPVSADSGEKVDIESVVATLLQKREVENTVRSNTEIVSKVLTEKFGADAQIHLNKKASELGVSLDYLRRIATESPKAFFSLIGVSEVRPQTPPVVAPRAPGQSAPPQAHDGTRNKSYYDSIRAKNPTEYFSSKTQQQMYKDAMAQGDSFYS